MLRAAFPPPLNTSGFATVGQLAAQTARIDTLLAGADPSVDTFIEAFNRFMADESNAATITANLASEATARQSADTALQSAINAKFTLPSGGLVSEYIDGTGARHTFPSIPAAQVQADYTQASSGAVDFIKNKPALFSGTYADLTGKPSLFSGAYADLTGKPTIPTVPTVLSAFTNDSNFITTAGARGAISLTTTGTSGASTYNSTTGVFNVPQYVSTPLSVTAPADLGTVASVGVGTTAARADHVHKGPVIAAGTNTTSAILLAGNSVDVVVTLSGTMPNATYSAIALLTNSSLSVLGTLDKTIQAKTTTTVTVRLKNNGLITVATGQVVEVIAISPSV